MSCKGICAYPHGGWATTALLVASAAGLAATGCGALSCRFVRLSFAPTSDGGCFEDAFRPDVTSGAPDVATAATNSSTPSCQVGLGLYQWLQPAAGSSSGGDWTAGTCVGYQQTMLDRLNDPTFQAARGVGVFAVLLAFVLFLWDFVLSCLQLNRLQVWLLRLCSLLAVMASGLTFLMNRSAVCGGTSSALLLFDHASCAVDQGALAMLAACLLWFGHLVVATVWIRTPKATSRYDESTDRDDDPATNAAATDPTTRQQQRRDDVALKAHVLAIRARNGNQSNDGSKNGSRGFGKSSRNRPSGESESILVGSDPEEVPRKPRSWFGSRKSGAGDDAIGDGDAPRSQQTLTVDDVTSQEQLEVYLSRRLDAIEKHIDED